MFFFFFWKIFKKTLIPWYLQRFVAVHCGVQCTVHCACAVRPLYVHCTCTVRALYVHCTCSVRALYVHCTCTVRALYVHYKTRSLCNSASGGMEEYSLFVGSNCEDESVFGLGFGTYKREFVQTCVCKAINPKKINFVLLCLLGRSFEDESVFGLRFWQMQKEFVQACVCTSINQNIFPGLSPGSSKKTVILSNSLRRNLHAPFPPIQCCYIALLGKAFKKNSRFGLDAGMHGATTLIKGARGDQV